MRQREHSGEASPAAPGASPGEAIRATILIVAAQLGAVTAPLLVLSGTQDDRTPLAEALALFANAPEPKRFWPVQGASHVDLERYDPDAY